MTALHKESLFALFVSTLGVLFWVQTSTLTDSAAMFPRLLIVMIILLSAGMLLQTARSGCNIVGSPVNIPRIVAYLALLLAYVFCAEPVGYFIVTPVFIVVASAFLRAMSFKGALLTSLGFSLFIYGLFVEFLHLPVPLGLLENVLGG